MSDKDLVDLCHKYFDIDGAKGRPKDIMSYFAKIINAKQTINMTSNLKPYIPLLAGYENGILMSLLTETINGLSPKDLVPDLNFQSPFNLPKEPNKALTARAPRSNRSQLNYDTSAVIPKLGLNRIESVDDLEKQEFAQPKTTRRLPNAKNLITMRTTKRHSVIPYLKPLPPLEQTEESVLKYIYVSRDPQFYIGKKMSEEDKNYKIIPTTYPDHMIGDKYTVLTSTGVVRIDGNAAVVQDVDQFIRDERFTKIIENQMITKRVSYRSWYHWRMRLREVLFNKIIQTYNNQFDVSVPNFYNTMEKIRKSVFNATNQATVYTKEFDIGNDEATFKDLQEAANKSIYELDKKISHLKDEVGLQISEVFRIIRAANVLIQLNFEELSSLEQVPPSLKQFRSDLKSKVPSLWREKMREQILAHERKLAKERIQYLSTFFSKVRISYNGILILKYKEMMMGFFDRFLSKPKNRRKPHKIVAEFNEITGKLTITPTRDEFINWFNFVVNSGRSAFFQNLETIWNNLIIEMDPNYHFEIECPSNVIDSFQDYTDDRDEALDSINDAFNYFEHEISIHQIVFSNLINKLNDSNNFTDLRNIDKLEIILSGLQKVNDDLSKKPKNIFHKPKNSPEGMADFIVAFSGTVDSALELYNREVDKLKMKILNELNVLFQEIQDKWSAVKDTKITKLEARALEARTLQYSFLCDSFCGFWKDAFAEVKASFDTVMKMYRQLSDKCKYTHAGAAKHFNKVAETLGLGGVPLVEEEEEEYYEEETEYEDESDD